MFRKTLLTAALAVVAAVNASAQTPTPTPTPRTPAPSQTPTPAPTQAPTPGNGSESPAPVKGGNNQFRAKQILGSSITIQGDTSVGTVDDLVFDDAGNLEYLIVDNAGKLTTVPWEAAKFDLEKKTAVLPLTAAQYNVIPTYTTTTYPSFYTPAYRTQVYRFYSLTPRELRRIERR